MSDGISALFTEVGQNMGDHAESVTRAIAVSPTETIQELLERVMPEPTSAWNLRRYENFIVLRFVEPDRTTNLDDTQPVGRDDDYVSPF